MRERRARRAPSNRLCVLPARARIGAVVKRQFERVFFEPRGHQACGGLFVLLECGHVIVVEPGHKIEKAHDCWHCVEGARIAAMLRAYLPPRG